MKHCQQLQTFFVLFLLSGLCSGQANIPFNSLKSADPNDTLSTDLIPLDSIFKSKTIIGLGESTHGTSEFTTMRHRIFRYLVEKHNYNTFFLEADFSACQRVNRYIHGANDTALIALREVRLWPWITKEMISLIEWMREYNSRHSNKLNFVGCDMQLISDDAVELKRFFKKYPKSNWNDSLTLYWNHTTLSADSLMRKRVFTEWKQFESGFRAKILNESDKFEFGFICLTIDQYFKSLVKHIAQIRDSCMGGNIAHYMSLLPETKGIYFAHNWHVSKTLIIYKGQSGAKTAGQFLNELLQSNYFCIGLELYQGKVNALTYKNKKTVEEVFTLEPSKKKTLGYFLNGLNSEYLFCLTSNIPKINEMKITDIGAIYGRNEFGFNQNRYRSMKDYFKFDGIIFIKNTKETTILKSKWL